MKVNVRREIGITVHLSVHEADTLRGALLSGVPINTRDKYLAGHLCEALGSALTIVNNLPTKDTDND